MRVSMQEFKSHLAQYVVQAQNGQLIELTSHRKVVAKVVGVRLNTSKSGVEVMCLRFHRNTLASAAVVAVQYRKKTASHKRSLLV